MPPRIPKACRHRGCKHTTTDRGGYCTSHKGAGWKARTVGRTRQQRGYGRKWEMLRARVLKRDNHLCQHCLQKGIATQANNVDHIKPKAQGGTDSDCNLQALCKRCHKLKTARERLNNDHLVKQ